MRVRLPIDEDVLVAAMAIAEEENRDVGAVVSDLARNELSRRRSTTLRNGVPVLHPRSEAVPVTLDIVNGLRDGVA